MKPERCFADTNLFLRYLTNDVPSQADAVESLLRRAAAGELVLVVSSLVIAEIVWVLESFYHLPRDDVQARVLAILNTPGLEFPEASLVLQAVVWYAEQGMDFVDAYNGDWMLAQGISTAYTFDRGHFARLQGVEARVPNT